MAAIWLTPAGNLGIIPESVYYQAQLDAYNASGGTLTYSLITGSLPSGLTLTSTGMISGIPNAVTAETASNFTIRITNSSRQVTDRSFSLTVGFIVPPVIVPEPGSLGTYVSGDWVDLQLTATEPVGSLTSTFSLYSGTLPSGLTLTDTGRIYGYLRPVISDTTGQQSGFDASAFDKYVFDFLGVELNKNYVFSVKAYDGAASDINTFSIFVYSRNSATTDTTALTADNVTIITTDTDKVYSPVLYTDPGSIGNIRQNARFAFQFQAEDFNADTLTFTANANAFPTGLTLSSVTGWLTGVVPYGALGSSTYNFTVNVSKVNKGITYTSQTRDYSVKLIGRISDTVNWITGSNIGSIYNGSISEFSIQATTPSGKTLLYSLVNNSVGAMPYGLTLLSDGTISGRASFNVTSPNQTFTFTVAAYDSDNLVYDEKEFTITVIKRDQRPYDNLYVQGLFSRDQRQLYEEFINNGDVFPNDYIYRVSDPWFGKNTLRRSLFLTGLNPDTMAEFVSAMQLNHYEKTLRLGEIKNAQALDENFNVKYEVVYVDLIDQYTDLIVSNSASGMTDTISTPLAITWPTNTQGITTVYPNSFTNMVKRISANVGFQDRSILPSWMTSRQPDGTVLGFTRCLVLAYVNPGRSAEVAFRAKEAIAANYTLSYLDYTIDRYLLDSVLSNNFIVNPVAGSGTITANIRSSNVVGAGSAFTSNLAASATIYSSNITLGNVSNIITATSLTLSANSLSNVSSSTWTYSNIFIVNNYSTGSGSISANTNSNVVTGQVTYITGSGTISGAVGNTNVIGSGTKFGTELAPGKQLYTSLTGNLSANIIGTITSIISDTTLKLLDPLNSTISGSSYYADGNTTLFTTEIHNGDVIVANGVQIGTVNYVSSDTSLILTANSTSNIANVSYTHTKRDPYTIPGQGDLYLKFPQVNILA